MEYTREYGRNNPYEKKNTTTLEKILEKLSKERLERIDKRFKELLDR